MALSRAGSSPAFGTIGAREASLGGAAIRAAAPELSLIACARSHLGGAAIRAAAPGQDAGSGHSRWQQKPNAPGWDYGPWMCYLGTVVHQCPF